MALTTSQVGASRPFTRFGDGSVAAPSLSFIKDKTTGFYRVSAGSVGFASSGVLVFQIGANGIVGIGTAAVAGRAILATMTFTDPSTLTAGLVLNAIDKITSGASGQQFLGVSATLIVDAANNQNWTNAFKNALPSSGLFGRFRLVSGASGTITGISAVNSDIRDEGSTCTVIDFANYMAQFATVAAGATYTNRYGFYFVDAASARVTNQYGIYIEAPTLAATINTAIRTAGLNVIAAAGKWQAESGVVSYSVVSTALTQGTSGSLVIPYLSQTGAAFTDAIGGNVDGAIGINYDSDTGPTSTIEVRSQAAWVSVAVSGYLMQNRVPWKKDSTFLIHPNQLSIQDGRAWLDESLCYICGEKMQSGEQVTFWANGPTSRGVHAIFGHTHLERDEYVQGLNKRIDTLEAKLLLSQLERAA